MATFGIYQLLDPLYVTPTGSVCSAKIVGGEATGRIAAKVFNPTKADPDEPNWEPKYFLDRAQVQRRVAASGGAHWAPVYALGFTPDGGAYYVTDYHALTAQKMIDGRVAVDAAALHAIVRSVVAGLEEIRKIAGRAHANLKPSNVLLVGRGPADELRAVLCDPGQEYKAQKEGEAGDLRAVGVLIHELVLNRPPGGTDFAAPGDPTWQERLGDKGEAWRQLCADLLSHPIPARAATLSAAAKVIDGLAPSRLKVPHLRLPGGGGRAKKADADKAARRPRAAKVRVAGGPSKFKRRLVQGVALLLLLGGTVGVLSVLEAGAREEVCTAKRGWFGSLAASLAEPQRRERYAADAHLRRITEGVDEVERAGVECARELEDPKFNPLAFLNIRKTREAAAALRQVEQDLAPESWPQLAKLQDLARVFEQRGWQQPSGYVTRLLEGVRPTPVVSAALASRPSTGPDAAQPAAGSLALRIDRVLRLRPIIEQQAAASYEDWKNLEERSAALAASPDPVVHGFGEFLKRDAVASIKLTDEGFEGLTRLKLSAGTAHQVLESLRTIPPGELDNVRFDEQVASRINPAEPTMEKVKEWLSRRPQFLIQRDAINAALATLQKSYDETRGEVAKSEPLEAEVEAFAQEQKDIEAALRDLRQTPFIQQDLADKRLAGKVVEIQRQIDNLRLYYHAENPADWLANLDRAGIASSSERVRGVWDSWVRILRDDLEGMKANRDWFTQNKTRTDNLRDLLNRVELEFPPAPEDLSTEKFADAARRYREEQIGRLLEGIRVTDPQLKPEALKQAADVTAAWFANLRALNKDFPIRKTVLTLADKPDAPWRAKEKLAFWNDRTVQQLVREDVERLELIRKVPKSPRDALAKLASDDAARDEVVLAAWQQLGQVSPPWPASVEELKQETALRGRVKARLGQLTPAERKGFDEAFAQEGPRRWRRFVESADREEMLVAALQRRKGFDVEADVLAAMPAEARFNVWLCLANSAIQDDAAAAAAAAETPGGTDRAKTSDTFDTIVDNLEAAAKELNDEAKSSQVLEKLARLKAPEPFDNLELGDVFEYRPKGLNDDPIEFRRVDPSDGSRPFYLATREITFGQFVGAVEGEGLWDVARQLTWPYAPGKTDTRRGSRVWEWGDGGGPPRLVLPRERLWMTPDRNANRPEKHNDFPLAFRPESRFNRNVISPQFGGMPSERHPMQYVTAQAAVYYAAALGCRLPTSQEWRHALTAATGPAAGKTNWNLRDASWEVFRRHAEKESIARDHWPDRGAFGEPAAGVNVNREGDDGALLFRPVPSAGGAFHDLIGNVAEYVLEKPEAFARWTSKQTAQDIQRFLNDTPNAVGVIGGSALSSPDLPLDKPLLLPGARQGERLFSEIDRGFSDVGLRLAFTAPARTHAERLKWVLAGEKYLFPRTASAARAVAQ